MRSIGREPHREPAREVTVRPRGVLPDAVRQPAGPLWKAALEAALITDGIFASHRATILRAPRRQNAH